jgi:hypothetical protein
MLHAEKKQIAQNPRTDFPKYCPFNKLSLQEKMIAVQTSAQTLRRSPRLWADVPNFWAMCATMVERILRVKKVFCFQR